MDSKSFYMPTKPYTLIDAINRRAAATGSVGYAQASVGADYNGNDLSLTWNEYRGWYVLQYFFGERVVLCRSSCFEVALEAAKQAYEREGRGASLKVVPRDVDAYVAEADPELHWGREPEGLAFYAGFPDPAWKYVALVDALFFDRQCGTSLVQDLLKAETEDDWRKALEDWKHPSRCRGCACRVP